MSEFSMLTFLNRRTRSIGPLLFLYLALPILAQTANASLLKDIRVGEYEDFTRIVFELDGPAIDPHIETQAPGQLAVSFEDTQANLIRKIPVERSRHVGDIQIWQRQGQLAVVLTLDYGHFRFETFPLSSPPRIAVDIFPLIEPPQTSSASGTAPAVSASLEETRTPTGDISDDQTPVLDEEHAAVQPSPTMAETKPHPSQEKNPVIAAPLPRQSATQTIDTDRSATAAKKTRPGRLQFYLVIMLVVITIVILVLLFLMLVTRHRLSDEKASLSASEFLQDQDKKIAALNSRIKEQFKRYEEA